MKTNSPQPLSLKIDFREKNSGIMEALSPYADLFQLEMLRLNTGDYLLNDQILIERKRLPDFIVSIKTGRLFQQAYRMVQSEYHPLIILEGSKSEVNQSKMKREAVQGTLIHLTVFLGIPIIRSAGTEETARLIRYTGLQLNEWSLPRSISPIVKRSGLLLNVTQRKALAVLINIPGIGTEKGVAMIRAFKSLKEILNAGVDELKTVRGIGPKLAEGIFKLVNEPFDEETSKQ